MIDFVSEIEGLKKINTNVFVKELASKHNMLQRDVKAELEGFLTFALFNNIVIERASKINLDRWKRYRMPVYKGSYVSFLINKKVFSK